MHKILEKYISYLIWPITLGIGFTALWVLKNSGMDGFLALFLITVVIFFSFMALEFILPYKKEWDLFKDKQSINDILHFVTTEIAGRGFGIVLALISSKLALKHELWPAQLPVGVQVIIAFLIVDFIDYWRHRISHTFVFWWRLHAIHHSVTQMHILKGTRHYFIDMMWTNLVLNLPLIIMGAPKDVFLWHTAMINFLSVLTHANVSMKFPKFFHYIFVSSPVHFIHHSIILKEGNSNYGSIFTFWDILFGTFTDPNKRPVPLDAVGIENDPVPNAFHRQLLFPFIWNGK